MTVTLTLQQTVSIRIQINLIIQIMCLTHNWGMKNLRLNLFKNVFCNESCHRFEYFY